MGVRRKLIALLPFLFFLSFDTFHFCTAIAIKDPESVTSSGEIFKLGFFSPGNSSNRYVGIWYNKIPGPTVVWVANRENPLTDSSGVLKIADDGNLVVLDGQQNVLWTTNISNIAKNSTAELLDSGNLILHEQNSNDSNNNQGRFLWDSFGHPSNTILPTMKLTTNQRTGERHLLTSWKSDSDPSTGSFFTGVDSVNIPQIVIWNGSRRHWRSGPWNNQIFIGVNDMNSVYLNGFNLVKDDPEGSAYVTFTYVNKSLFLRYVLNSLGILVETSWDEAKKQWVETWFSQENECDVYGKCGVFGSCNIKNSPICSCLRGFEPKSMEEWNKGNWSGGCVRRTQLQCERNRTNGEEGKADGFLKLKTMKVPDFPSWLAAGDTKGCEEECLKNCSCIAYSFDSGIGCMSWSGNLIDIQKFSTDGVDLYIRLAHSELDKAGVSKVIIIVIVLTGLVTISAFAYFSWRWMAKQRGRKKKEMEVILIDEDDASRESLDSNMLGDNPELPIFNFEKLAIATNNFDGAHKLGQGGFGSVYKGNLPDGHEIAVKRLSKSSGQGVEEFKNEVVVISKLQHRNLVRLLGCCIEGEEKMLIYEYMPNKSLDAYLFDSTKRALLDWGRRFHIIEGISRGLLYLHRDSRLKIIHRDLKASNILLDEGLNPKISDFGMARIFGGNELEAETRRVVGTYGYMSPEYAMEGRFSEKSDVFSFGVLILEIVSGKRNSSFYHHEQAFSFWGHAWQLWNEDKIHQLIDPTLSEPCFQAEILRCIHVALLCVQEFAKDRPTMASLVSMLTSEIATLPTPKQPAFIERQVSFDSDTSLMSHTTCSINDCTVTIMEAR